MRVCHDVRWDLSEQQNISLSLPSQFNKKSVQIPAFSTHCPTCSKDYGQGDVLQGDNSWPHAVHLSWTMSSSILEWAGWTGRLARVISTPWNIYGMFLGGAAGPTNSAQRRGRTLSNSSTETSGPTTTHAKKAYAIREATLHWLRQC